jgi:hypothetical protein
LEAENIYKNVKRWGALALLSFMVLPGLSQPAPDDDYGKEISWGITKATNSGLIGGAVMKYSIRHRNDAFHYFALEIVNIKDPKEERYYSFTGNTYIYGKSNYLYSLRLQGGRSWIFFKKAPQQGVQIDGIVALGPSLGIVAPYYIEYLRTDGNVVREQYDPNIHFDQNNILGTGNLFQGIGESNLVFGLNSKVGISFEFGTLKYNVFGLEVGFMMEAFTKKIPIIPTAEQNQIFPNSFVTLYYGSRR